MANIKPQAMTREQMEDIKAQYALPGQIGRRMTVFDIAHITDLLAQVERLRAREAALAEIVRWVAEASETHATPREYAQVSQLHFSGVGAAGWLRQKARALLAAQDMQADGEQDKK